MSHSQPVVSVSISSGIRLLQIMHTIQDAHCHSVNGTVLSSVPFVEIKLKHCMEICKIMHHVGCFTSCFAVNTHILLIFVSK